MNRQRKRQKAMELYCAHSKSLAAIADELNVPASTLYRWKKNDKWDDNVAVSSIATSISIEKALGDAIREAIENDTLADPKTADAISKLQKVVDKLKPKQQILGNIYLFLEDLASYATEGSDRAFANSLANHLPAIGDYMRRKHGGESG